MNALKRLKNAINNMEGELITDISVAIMVIGYVLVVMLCLAGTYGDAL